MPEYIKYYLLVLFGFFMVSCGPTPYYEEYVEVPEQGWASDSIIRFTVPIKDTSSSYMIYLNLRSNSNYPYRNIYLFREISSKRGTEFVDTAEYYLADAYGKWLGEGIGDLKTHHLSYSGKALKFIQPGEYTFKIQQAMRTDRLEGLEDIGLSIFKTQKGD